VVSLGVIWLQPHHLAEFLSSLGELPRLPQDNSQSVVRIGQSRVELDRRLQFLGCRGEIIFQLVCQAQVVVELGIVGCESKPVFVLLNGGIEISLLQIYCTQIVAIGAIKRRESNRRLKLPYGLFTLY